MVVKAMSLKGPLEVNRGQIVNEVRIDGFVFKPSVTPERSKNL